MAVCTNLLQGQTSEWALLKRHPCEDIFGVQVGAARREGGREGGGPSAAKFQSQFRDDEANGSSAPVGSIQEGTAWSGP